MKTSSEDKNERRIQGVFKTSSSRRIFTGKVLELNQKAWLKPYEDMNTELRTKAINIFEKESFKQINNSVFGNTMENVKNHRDIKIVPNV